MSKRHATSDVYKPTHPKYNIKREVPIYVESQSEEWRTGLVLNVVPVPCVVDHTFRYFEQADQVSTIQLPPLYAYSRPDVSIPHIEASEPKLKVQWVNDNEI